MEGATPSPEAFQLLLDGALVLARSESNGICINEEYLDQAIADITVEIDELQSKIKKSKIWKQWQDEYKEKAKLGSLEQLAHLFFDLLGYESPGKTPTGRHKADEEAISTIGHPFIKRYMKLKKLKDFKAKSLVGLKSQVVDGKFHPNFNLHIASTYRSSSGASKDE